MAFCLSHESAAAFWCWASRVEATAKLAYEQERADLAEQGVFDMDPIEFPPEAACMLLAGPHAKQSSTLQPATRIKETRNFAESHELSLPLHIVVSDQAYRQKKGATVSHVVALDEDAAPIFPLADGNSVVSPALALVQMARELDLVDWLILAYEFCGTYTLDPAQPEGFAEREPLTSVEEIKQTIDALAGAKGIKTARAGLAYLANGSASPKETGLALELALPRRLHGFAIGTPQMNASIMLQAEARALYPRDTCRCDLFFPEKNVAVEYDSDAEHATEEKKDSDALRRIALSTEGLEVVPVRFEQVKTYAGMRATAKDIAKKCGVYLRADSDEKAAKALTARLMGFHAHPWD